MKTCTQCSTQFEVLPEDKAMLEKIAPMVGGEKIALPEPELCFDCRLTRKMAFYNRRQLYKRKSAFDGKSIISVYSPDKAFKAYPTRDWYSDKWDPLEYGRDFDFSRGFFEQFAELLRDVPHNALAVIGDNLNSDFTNDNYKLKNCYLIFDGEQAEGCSYGESFVGLKDCMDFLFTTQSELCYEVMFCSNSYNLKYSQYCKNCSDSWFLRDCIGCKNCVGCTNLQQKQYYIYNEPYSKEEYEKKMGDFKSGDYRLITELRKKAEEFNLSQPVKATRNIQCQNCVGDNLNNSKDSYYCFDCHEQRDCRYVIDCMVDAKDCMDIYAWGDHMERGYNSLLVGARGQNIYMSSYCAIGVSNILYSHWCTRNCHNMFGCFALKQKKYCILNKQYSEKEYEKMVLKIVEHMKENGEWGQFFPPSISAYGYNETLAQDYYPLTKEEALEKGFQWSDYEVEVEAQKVVAADQIPVDIDDVEDDILNWAIKCEVTGRPFKIIESELKFYRKQKMPIPRRHPDQRHRDRLKYRNPYHLWDRKCAKCGVDVKTSYALERPEIVYCEDCYYGEFF
jgi:hypothetical protein